MHQISARLGVRLPPPLLLFYIPMELIKHTKYIYEYKNIVDSSLCDYIITLVENTKINNSYLNETRNKIRNASTINLTQIGNYNNNIKKADILAHKIFSETHNLYTSSNKLYYFSGREYVDSVLKSQYYYRIYNKKDYYDWHVDFSLSKMNLFSYVLYLNDDFSGGKTIFLNDKISISPSKGSMICFPCDMQTIHKSTRINTGTKKIIWSCFYKEF